MGRAGQINTAQATFTPAATSHTAGDVVGGAQEFKGLSTQTAQGVQIISASLLVTTPTLLTSTWRVYLFNVTPPSALADDAAFLLPAGDLPGFLGYVDIAQLVDAGDNLYVQSDNINKPLRPAGGRSAFGYLVCLATVTLVAQPHLVTLWTLE
jgi:hypothetical protein